MIKGVIFDLDGTLLDTLDDLGSAMNKMLMQFGFPVRTRAEHQSAICYGAREFVRLSLPENKRDENTVNCALAAYRTYYAAACTCGTYPYEGIAELLQTLLENEIPVAVYSNKPMEQTKSVVAHYFGQIPFTAVIGHRMGTPTKPDPTVALEIACKMGLQPSELAFVGDSEVDMKTACHAGMVPIGVLWGYRQKEDLVSGGAKALCENTESLKALLS